MQQIMKKKVLRIIFRVQFPK